MGQSEHVFSRAELDRLGGAGSRTGRLLPLRQSVYTQVAFYDQGQPLLPFEMRHLEWAGIHAIAAANAAVVDRRSQCHLRSVAMHPLYRPKRRRGPRNAYNGRAPNNASQIRKFPYHAGLVDPDAGVLHRNIVLHAAGHQAGPAVDTAGSIDQETIFMVVVCHLHSPAWSGLGKVPDCRLEIFLTVTKVWLSAWPPLIGSV